MDDNDKPNPDEPEQTQDEAPDPTATATSAIALVTAMPEPVLPAGFDYKALGPELAQATRASVAIIHEQNRRGLEAVWIIGMEGVRLRDSHPYGVFMKIVKDEFGEGYWNTLNRCINVYERLGDDRFRILRNLPLNDTTLYALAMRSTPEYVRCEIADGIQSGTIPTNAALDAEIKRRVDEARNAGVLPQTPSAADTARARQMRQRDHALIAVQMLKTRWTDAEYAKFNHHCSRAGKEFDRVRLAQPPDYTPQGFVFDFPTVDGLPLTDRQLEDYQLARDSSSPPLKEWEPAYIDAMRERDRQRLADARMRHQQRQRQEHEAVWQQIYEARARLQADGDNAQPQDEAQVTEDNDGEPPQDHSPSE